MTTGKTTKHAASVPFHAADYLQADDLPGYLAEVTAEGDTRALPLALRDAPGKVVPIRQRQARYIPV